MRNFSDKIDNTAPLASGILSALEDNTRFKELENAVSTSGIALDGPSGADSDVYMLAQSMARYASGGVFCQDTGLANAYVLGTPGLFTMPKAFFQNMMIMFYPANPCTGPATVNAFGLGIKKILSAGAQPLVDGEISTGLVHAVYDTTLDSGAGAFKMTPWSDLFQNVAGGIPIYEGIEAGRHKLRTFEAGTNVTIDLVETSVGSGDYRLRISSVAGTGSGGGGNPLENVGTGGQVYKGFDDVYDELRSIKGVNSVAVSQQTDELQVGLASIAAWSLLLRNNAADGVPAPTLLTALTEETTPAANDVVLLGKSADGALRKVKFSKFGGVSGGFIPVAFAMVIMPDSFVTGNTSNFTYVFTPKAAGNRIVVEGAALIDEAPGASSVQLDYNVGAGWVNFEYRPIPHYEYQPQNVPLIGTFIVASTAACTIRMLAFNGMRGPHCRMKITEYQAI